MDLYWSVVAGAALVALSAGCASASEVPSEAEASSAALSPSSASYVSVHRDTRDCSSPKCGGYFVHELNRSCGDRYVSDLDLTALAFAPESERALRAAPDDEVILRGRLGSVDPRSGLRALVVTDAYRGLPGVKVAQGDAFYAVLAREPQVECFAAPCPNEVAREVNRTPTRLFDVLRVDRAAWPRVDKDWLSARVLAHGALVAGSFTPGQTYAAGRELVLDASQVFVRLPDEAGPCSMRPLPACESGDVMSFQRTPDRCLVPTGCVKPGICPLYVPSCGDGYVRVSWRTAAAACAAFACDPAFLAPGPQP